MKKQIFLILLLIFSLITSCKKERSEFLVSEMQTLKALVTPGIKEEFPVNQLVTFYVKISKVNKPKVNYTLRENYANSSTVITSGTVDEQYTGYEASFDYTPKQNKDLVTLELKVTCGNEVITRYKYLVVK